MSATRDGWNHNTHYHEQLLRAVPRPCRRALDIGCGVGQFARRLASVVEHVDAIDLNRRQASLDDVFLTLTGAPRAAEEVSA